MARELGPVEYIVVEFNEGQFEGKILQELANLQDREIITILDFLFIHKDEKGDVTWVDYDALGEVVASVSTHFADNFISLLSEADAAAVAADLEPGDAVAIMVFEDTWATKLQQAVGGAGGRLIEASRVPKDAVDAAVAFVESKIEEVG